MNNHLKLQEELTCDECGQLGATEIGEGSYCPECYGVRGSSCAGGRDEKPIE